MCPTVFWYCSTAGSPLGTPEPLVLLTPPRCLTANRTQHGVLLTWLPPANHSSPIDRYIMEFRLGERWEVLDDLISSTETEIIAKDLVQVSVLENVSFYKWQRNRMLVTNGENVLRTH